MAINNLTPSLFTNYNPYGGGFSVNQNAQPYGNVNLMPYKNEMIPNITTTEKSSNAIQSKGKNDKLSLMLFALGGALKGDKNFVQNTMQLQQMQEGKRKQEEQDRLWEKFKTEHSIDPQIAGLGDMMNPNQRLELMMKTMDSGGTGTAGMQDFQFYQSLKTPEEKLAFLISTGRGSQSPELQELLRKARSPGGVDLTPGQISLDKKFATTAESWLSKDAAQVDANIMNLEEKIGIIERGEADVSGKVIGITPEFLQPFVGQTEAKAFLGDVRDIVFQSLKEKLGAQFTEKEGDRLVAAAYDPSLPEELNAKRLRRLLSVVKTMKVSKDGMVEHWNRTGTLKDYEPPKATFNNIYDAIVQEEFQNKTTEELTTMYANTKDLDKKTAIIRYAEKLAEQGK
jgi:hypothetical protein